MEYTIPHYFDKFKCAAAECEDSCCVGWEIVIDDDSLERYKNVPGDLGSRLKTSVDWKKGSFLQWEGRCAFLNDDNLCDLQKAAGEKMLCATCRDYPRHMEEFEGVREGSLTLSCIEAAKIILGCQEPVQFFELQDDTEDEEYEDFDYLLYTKLCDARKVIFLLLQNRNIDINVRISLCLELAERLQKALDEDRICSMDEILEEYLSSDIFLRMEQRKEEEPLGENEYCSNMRKLFRMFQKLEVLKKDWPELVKRAEVVLYGEGRSGYLGHKKKFHKLCGQDSIRNEEWSIRIEQLMVYFVYIYFCGAVYDGRIANKMKMAAVTTMLIQELCIARWAEQEEQFSFADLVDIAHRISRELEHSEVNILRMEKIFETSPLFETTNLIQAIRYQLP